MSLLRPIYLIFILIASTGILFTSCRTAKPGNHTAKKKNKTEKISGSGKTSKNKPAEDKTKKEADHKIRFKYAELLGVSTKEIQNIRLYEFIDDWQGVPYKYGGRSKNGVDCSNFATLICQNIYSKNITGSCVNLYGMCNTISKNDLREGDLVFFKINKDKISHVGVYLHNNKFVHATTKRGVMINDLDEAYYKKYFFKAGRLK